MGAAVGGLVVLALIVALAIVLYRRRKSGGGAVSAPCCGRGCGRRGQHAVLSSAVDKTVGSAFTAEPGSGDEQPAVKTPPGSSGYTALPVTSETPNAMGADNAAGVYHARNAFE